jgi:FtsZ-interacting cell division protein YlmF
VIPILESDDEDDDDEDEDDEDEDDEDEDDEDHDTRFDGSNASAEYARSARSRCVMCNLSIANRELRISVTQSYEYHDSNTRFIHPRCIRAFNEMVSTRQRIQPARINLRGISAADAQIIRNSF